MEEYASESIKERRESTSPKAAISSPSISHKRTLTPQKRPRLRDNPREEELKQSSTSETCHERRDASKNDLSAERVSRDLDEQFLQRLLDAAHAKDAKDMSSLLGYKQNRLSNYINDPLLPISLQDSILQRIISSPHSQTLLLALLDHVPTAYEIPWIAATLLPTISSRSTLASIQHLLRSAVAAWCQHERKQLAQSSKSKNPTANSSKSITPRKAPTNKNDCKTPRHYILQLVEQCTNALLHGRRRPVEDKDSTAFATELLLSLVAVVRNHADAALLNTCLDCIMLKSQTNTVLDSLDMVAWLQLASDLRRVLRSSDWKRAHRIVTEQVQNVALPDLAHAAKAIMTLAIHLAVSASTQNNQPPQRLMHWQQLWMEILHQSSTDLAIAASIEQASLQCMSQLTLANLFCFMNSFMAILSDESRRNDDPRRWTAIESSAILFIARCRRQMGSLLLTPALTQRLTNKSRQKQEDIELSCWKCLVSTILGDAFEDATMLRQPLRELTINRIDSILGGLTYRGKGLFIGSDGSPCRIISSVGTAVFDSLFLAQQDITTDDRPFAVQRARSWIHMAIRIVEKPAAKEDVRDWVFSCLALVTVYCEVPEIQSEIVEKFLDNFTRDRFFERTIRSRSHLLCQVISILVKVKPLASSSPSPLNKLAGAFDNQLPFDVFVDLASSLSSLTGTRRALLAKAKKYLQGASSFVWLSGAEASGVRRLRDEVERLKCALYGLVTSVATSRWESHEVEGWQLLSEIIIACKPSLPAATRSWVMNLLTDRVDDGAFDLAAVEHMLAAVLFRLFDFLDDSDDRQEVFSASKVILPIRHSNSSLTLVEDISRLLRLAVSLCHFLGTKRAEVKTAVAEWRRELLLCIAQSPAESGPPARRELPRSCTSDSVELDGTYIYLFRIMESLSGVRHAAYSSRKLLATRPRVSVLAQRVFSSLGSLPSWLHETSRNTAETLLKPGTVALDADHLLALHGILCGTIADVVLEWQYNNPSSALIATCDIGMSDAMRRKLVLGVCRLIAMAKHDKPTGEIFLPTSATARSQSLISLARMLVPVFETTICSGDSQADATVMVDAAAAMCTTIADCLASCEGKYLPIGRQLAQTTMKLYTSLSSEQAAARLCEYYKALRVRSDDAIALEIRSVRHRVVGLVAKCIPFAVHHHTISNSREVDIACVDGLDEFEPMIFLSDILSVTSRDLVEGMKGASGMIDYDLFDSFHECMQVSVGESIQLLSLADNPRHIHKLASSCILAGKNLERLVCSFTLRDMSIFKMTLRFSMHNLPLVVRTAIRRLHLLGVPVDFGRNRRQQSCHFTLESLGQCLAIMEKMSINESWHDIVGSEHMAEHFSPDKMPNERVRLSKQLQLVSEQHWLWALSLSLECLECLWDESSVGLKDGTTYFTTTEAAWENMDARRDELSRAWNSLTPLLACNSLSSSKAIRLPSRIKLRLIGVMERIVGVLQKALRVIAHYIQKSQDDSIARRLDVLESLGCLMVWFLAPGSIDLIQSATDWYEVEQEHNQRTKAALGRIDGLLDSLRRFERVIGSTKSKTSVLDRLIHRSEAAMSPDVGRGHEEGTRKGRLLQLVQAKRESMDKCRHKLSETERALLRDRSAEIAKRARKERGTKAFRSRNKAVDTFYNDDRKCNLFFIEQSGMDDAFDEEFYDLEDFLVDG